MLSPNLGPTSQLSRSDPPALLAVLLAATGLTQTDAAKLLGVAGRTMRRWVEGRAIPPASVFDRLAALARALDQAADAKVRWMDPPGGTPPAMVVYRRNRDLPPSCGWRTAGCHLAMVRRIVERRPDVRLVSYQRWPYRRWLGDRADTEEKRAE